MKYKDNEDYIGKKVPVKGYKAPRYKKKATAKPTTKKAAPKKTVSKFPLRKGQAIYNYGGKRYKYMGVYPKQLKGKTFYMFEEEGLKGTQLEELKSVQNLIKSQKIIKKQKIETEINIRRSRSKARNELKQKRLLESKFSSLAKTPFQLGNVVKAMTVKKCYNGICKERYKHMESLVRKAKKQGLKRYKLRNDGYIQFTGHSTLYPVSTKTEYKYFDYLMKKT